MITALASTSRETPGAIYSFSAIHSALPSTGGDLRQPWLGDCPIAPARTALRITALDRDRASAGLARQRHEKVGAVEKDNNGRVRYHGIRGEEGRAAC